VLQRQHAALLMEHMAPDVLEAADPYRLGWAVLDAAKRLNIPAVAFCHSHLPALLSRLVAGRDAPQRSIGRWTAARAQAYLVNLYDRYDLVLAPSRTMVNELRRWGVQRVLHQPLGVDCQVFKPEAQNLAWQAQVNCKWDLSPRTRWLIYCGRFGEEKNLSVLADAVQKLGPGHLLLAVGAGPHPPRGSHVRVLPPQTDARLLARWLASSDVFVHAGDQETFGLAALEAMACGTPLVTHAAGGLGELVQGVGEVVASLRVEEWAQALHAQLSPQASPSTAIGRQRALAHDWSRVLTQLTTRYRSLVKNHAPRLRSALSGSAATTWS
jgi:alpha-1,6-mannosyltransferase